MYKIAKVVGDTEKMNMSLSSLNRSHYAKSTKKKALANLKKWEAKWEEENK
jgi:ribosomal protein L28